MILNHKTAIELLVENVNSVGFNRYTILNLHSALLENFLPNPMDEGRIRQHIVDISQSVYRPLSVLAQIDVAFDTLLHKANQITDPFEQSFFVMVHLPYLQPFSDINKRVSRLAANLPLIRPDRAKRRLQEKFDPTDAESAARAVLSGSATAIPKSQSGAAEAMRTISVARRSAVKADTQAINQL